MRAQGTLFADIDVDVRFHDVDMVGVVWHGHYLRYLKNARWALMNQLGYGLERMLESGVAWPIVELQTKYLGPARFGDRLRVRASLVEWESRLALNYLVSRLRDGVRIARGRTVQVAVDASSGRVAVRDAAGLRGRRARGAWRGGTHERPDCRIPVHCCRTGTTRCCSTKSCMLRTAAGGPPSRAAGHRFQRLVRQPAGVGRSGDHGAGDLGAVGMAVARTRGHRPAIGLLLGVRSYAAPAGDFLRGETLEVEVIESSEDEEGKAVFECRIRRSGEVWRRAH